MEQYKQAGVDITAGDQFVSDISSLVKKTYTKGVIPLPDGYAGLFALEGYKNPVLVSSTDGVGTKIKLARQWNLWGGIGQDCVAMCVNDIGCLGAKPLFFLDYLATAKIEPKIMKQIVAGMASACQKIGCALLGGETAEMPGVYPPEEIDVAGFAVGAVERNEMVDGKTIAAGDVVIGVASSGFHSNGFSLIRKILEKGKINLQMPCAETGLTLAETLLLPTKLYTPLIQNLKKQISLKGIAHITGGGLIENPPRILPPGRTIQWIEKSWPIPEYMEFFREQGKMSREEFLRVFNAGIGLVLVVAPKECEKAIQLIKQQGEQAWHVGNIVGGVKS